MSTKHTNRLTPALAIPALLTMALISTGPAQAAAPTKLVLTQRLGGNVNKSTGGNVCVTQPAGECQDAIASSAPGGFEYPEDAAGAAANGNVYVADRGNNRVQELTPTGEFVLMFGKKVNKSTGGNICTKASGNTCVAGENDSSAGAFSEAQSIAVDPGSGNVYVLDYAAERVDEYTSGGEFVLMFGKEVNKNGSDICTKAEAGECQAGAQGDPESTEKAAFDFAQGQGDLLAVGGAPEHLLYVGDAHRVQEFNAAGEWKGEIRLPAALVTPSASITALAVDPATEDVYVVYGRGNLIRGFNIKGEELGHLEIPPREAGQPVEIRAIAVDSSGHLAVWASEGEGAINVLQFGALYQASDGQRITEFTTPSHLYSPTYNGVSGIGFNGRGELYAVFRENHELWSYVPRPIAELATEPARCVPGADHESDVTLDCSLMGGVDPWGVLGTAVWFQWGRSPALGQQTEPQPVASTKAEGEEEPSVAVSAVVHGVRPNESGFYYRMVARDANLPAPELASSFPLASFTTPVVAPRIVGAPSTPFLRSSSVVMFAQLNPENAATSYQFQYGQCAENDPSECSASPFTAHTAVLESAVYGEIGATLEASGLQPATVYHYRLIADDARETGGKSEGGETAGPEGVFMTPSVAVPQAATGAPQAVGASTATLTGSVNPGGQAATYAFELGVYNGAGTVYGVVSSGSAGAGSEPVAQSLSLSGLQPGSTYSYRVSVKGGYGAATGEAVQFTTAGLPEVLLSPVSPAQLATPNIVFPKAASGGKHKHASKRKTKSNKKHRKRGSRAGKRRAGSPPMK